MNYVWLQSFHISCNSLWLSFLYSIFPFLLQTKLTLKGNLNCTSSCNAFHWDLHIFRCVNKIIYFLTQWRKVGSWICMLVFSKAIQVTIFNIPPVYTYTPYTYISVRAKIHVRLGERIFWDHNFCQLFHLDMKFGDELLSRI